MERKSLASYWIVAILLLYSAFGLPDWRYKNTIRAFSYDALGYYLYLPAWFIYDDLEYCRFLNDIVPKYELWGVAYYPETLPNGKVLDKYTLGQAIFQLPCFLLAHAVAQPLGYNADGFSPPYHVIISLGNILINLLALWWLRRILLRYFPDVTVALSLLLLLVATNYWCYVGYNSVMVHASLFVLFVLLLRHTIRWHDEPNWWSSAIIGGTVGWAMLMRPTDVICVLVPLLWLKEGQSYQQKWRLFYQHKNMLIFAAILSAICLLPQLWYWKTITNSWIYYSYGDAKLEFFKPHVLNVLYSYKKGWLVYTPIMLFALIGFVPLYRYYRHSFWAIFSFFVVNFYLVSAWSVWWYGGSYGQRALVQSYVFLTLPFTAFWTSMWYKRWIWLLLLPLLGLFIWLNLTQTFTNVIEPEGNTRTYFWHVFGKTEATLDDRKYLQIDEKMTNANYQTNTLYLTHFEQTDSIFANSGMLVANPIPAIGDSGRIEPHCSPVLALDTLHKETPTITIPLAIQQQKGWIRVSMNVMYMTKEWSFWALHACNVRFLNDEKVVKNVNLRPASIVDAQKWTSISFETEIPTKKSPTHLELSIIKGNATTPQILFIDDLKVEYLY